MMTRIYPNFFSEFIQKSWILALFFLVPLLLTGCIPTLGPSNSVGTDEYLKGSAVSNFPTIPLYKGAKIVESYGFGGNFGMNAVSGDSTDKIAKFYNDSLPGLGWSVNVTQKSAVNYVFFVKNQSQQGSVIINPASDPKMSAITISVWPR